MRRLSIVTTAALLALAGDAAAADRTLKLSAAAPTVKWEGARASGVFVAFYGFVGQPCTKAPVMYCDETLFEIEFPEKFQNASLSIGPLGNGTDDFDAYLYRVNADGSVGEQVKYSNNPGTGYESLGWNIARGGQVDSARWLLKVPYYSVLDASYTATATVNGLAAPPPEPPPADPTPEPPPPQPEQPEQPEQVDEDAGKDGTQDEPERETTSAPRPAPADQPPAPTTPAPAAPAAPTAAARRAAPAALRLVRRRGSHVTLRLTCPVACRALVGAGRRSRRSLSIAAGDTHEITLRARPGSAVRAVVRPRAGGRAQVLRVR